MLISNYRLQDSEKLEQKMNTHAKTSLCVIATAAALMPAFLVQDKVQGDDGRKKQDGSTVKIFPKQQTHQRGVSRAKTAKEPIRSLRNQTIRYDKMKPAELRIQAALESPTSVEFVDNPLGDVITYLANLHDITITLDAKALAEIGVDPDEPITQTADASLLSVLNRLLKPLDLTHIIEDEAMQITSTDSAAGKMKIIVYSMRNLTEVIDSDDLADIFESTIEPKAWESQGGKGVVRPISNALIISNSQPVHREIMELLDQLIRHAQQPK